MNRGINHSWHSSKSCHEWIPLNLFQVFLKEFKNSEILIIPGIRACKPVSFGRVDHHFKISIARLNQLFSVLKCILCSYIIVYESVKKDSKVIPELFHC